MDYRDYTAELQRCHDVVRIDEFAEVRENDRDYGLLRLTTEGDRELVVTSGFHGEEPAGPVTILHHLRDIVAYANERRVALRIYPCVNPSGFEAGHRYNASGEKPNNDFIRYRLQDGSDVGELLAHHVPLYASYYVTGDGPKETRALSRELEAHPAPDAALDIHQDHYVYEPLVYAYAFGERAPHVALMNACEKIAKVARSAVVDDATRMGGQITRTDPDGLIEFHDGSVSDYFWRRGVPHVAAVETSTRTQLPKCEEINLIWIRGFIDLAAARKRG